MFLNDFLIKRAEALTTSEKVRRLLLMSYLGGLGGGAYGYLTADPDVESPAKKALSYGLVGSGLTGVGTHFAPEIYSSVLKYMKDQNK